MPQLILIPTPLSEEGILEISQKVLDGVQPLRHFVVEDLRTARRILRRYGFKVNFDEEVQFFEWDKHASIQNYALINQWLQTKVDIGLMSEAGLPCIADPGNDVVKLAHQYHYTITPLSGPSSIILALIASGFNGQNFAFNGYLPIDKAERNKKIKQLEARAIQENQTQIFMETPYRNTQLFSDILNLCAANTLLSVAADITGEKSMIKTMSIAEWKKQAVPAIHKIPAIFSLGK